MIVSNLTRYNLLICALIDGVISCADKILTILYSGDIYSIDVNSVFQET